ncbi:esterase-like activity of phytase family protein [Nocardia sp. BMG51109]|uniref:effector-associated constant component EACC1 n=1 Tax=Nocardia sp. BMG51109 TaxID=1056816 RepID=UPI0004638FDB|nr:esterase-like activity of phytase family protein [Nocardia sp. BMG51109]
MDIEFRFEAREGNDNSRDDLRTLYTHLTADPELQRHVRISAPAEPVRPGELGAAEVVLAAVSAGVGVGQLAVAVQAWRHALNRPSDIRVVVPDEHRGAAEQVVDALRNSEPSRMPAEKPDAARETAATAPAGRIDPANSACVLIGVDRYDASDLPTLRGVSNNLEQLSDVLEDEDIWGIERDRLRVVPNPRTPADLIRPIRKMSELATDTLIVYYSGHGLKNLDANELYLALPGSVPGQSETAVRYKDVKQAIKDGRQAQRVIIILDCCYSGTAIEGVMAASVEDIRADADIDDVRGSYLMCSAAANRKALAPHAHECTVFTGELVDVLRNGIPDETQPMLRLGTIFQTVRGRLKRKSGPEPQEQDQNQVGALLFAHNVARTRSAPAVGGAAPPPRRILRWLSLAAAVVLGFAGGLVVQPAIDVWHRQNPAPAAGACSANATLLDYSDQLDKADVRGERISGLSALALTDQSKVLALTDNASGRVFPVELGKPDDLDLRADTALTLRDAEGNLYGQPFGNVIDGEGMVIEPGTDTMLVSAEDGPTIHRFRRTDGREVGNPLPVPEKLQTQPVGGAQRGRTIESLTATADGRYLFAGWEAPLTGDGDQAGRNRLRIQRYYGEPGGTYIPDRQYAYEPSTGLNLADLAAVGPDRLLTLERQFVEGFGNTVRISELNLTGSKDVTDTPTLAEAPADMFVHSTQVFDLGDCPAGSPGVVDSKQDQPNPLLDNVEGMAVGPEVTSGPEQGSRLLYLVSDDNENSDQITRLYALRIRLP